MRKIIIFLLACVLICTQALAEELTIGTITYLGTTEAEFQEGLDSLREGAAASDDEFIRQLVKTRRVVKFYDSLMAMMMDLKSGRIHEIMLPETTARYLINNNKAHEIEFTTRFLASGISFGFKSDNTALKKEFDDAINSMKADGTLEALEAKYITGYGKERVTSIAPDKFENAEVIKAAVTGDMPPVDMFAGDGKPAGYNTAVLAEIGRRLKKNIELINIDSGGRSAALSSGRADVVFWYRSSQSNIEGHDAFDDLFDDVPKGVILSVPYFSWKCENVLIMKAKNSFLGLF
ncbi:MAG: transporter substrate-binding domain-containing protein [Synergistaceae bacterium]|nr:transporter substrate-binding domain-containing protein [Synergistaceae bacterium]